MRGKSYGPLSRDEIHKFLKKKELQLSHFVFDRDLDQWRMIGDHPEFTKLGPPSPTSPVDSKEIYIHMAEGVIGPLSYQQLVSLIEKEEVSLFHFIRLEKREDIGWKRIKDYPSFENLIPTLPVKKPPFAKLADSEESFSEEFAEIKSITLPAFSPKDDKEDQGQRPPNSFELTNDPIWMLEKGEGELGPFRYLEVVRMIQKSVITKSNKIRRVSEKNWRKIIDVFEFNNNVINKVIKEGGHKFDKVFVSRKFKRSTFLGPAKIKFRDDFYQGTCSSLSEGGCFVEIRPNDFSLGDELFISLIKGPIPLEIESFGKVVAINERSPRGIGIKFTDIKAEYVTEIMNFINKMLKN